METTNIRIQAGKEFYDALLAEQIKRRGRSGRKTSISYIIIDICNLYLFSGHFDQKSALKSHENDQNRAAKGSNDPDFVPEKYLKVIKSLEEFLLSRETALIQRERDLSERESRLREETDKFFEDKATFLDQQLSKQNQSIDGVVESRISANLAKKEIASRNDKIATLKEENEYLRQQLDKGLLRADKKKEQTLLQKLMPFLPSIITIVGMFLMYRKFEPGNEQDPIQKEINKVFKTLDPKNREEMTKALMEALRRFSSSEKAVDSQEDKQFKTTKEKSL